jgi:uncharacterized Zn finger protein
MNQKNSLNIYSNCIITNIDLPIKKRVTESEIENMQTIWSRVFKIHGEINLLYIGFLEVDFNSNLIIMESI